MTLTEAINTFLDARTGIVSPKTERINLQCLRTLENYFGAEREIESITLDDLRQWRRALVQRKEKYSGNTTHPLVHAPLSIWTVHGNVRMVRQFFLWLFTEGKTKSNPALRLEKPPLPDAPPKAISEEDAQKMIAAAKNSPRNYAILLFAYSTGCRLGGILNLRVSDLEFEHARALVHEKGRGGQNKTRYVFLRRDAIDALHAWLAVRAEIKPECDNVFVTLPTDASDTGGEPMSEKTMGAMLLRIAARASVKKNFNIHAWRHAFARRLTMKGAPLGVVSKIMGHSNTNITAQFYARLSTEELSEAHARYA